MEERNTGEENMKNIEMFRNLLSEIFRERNAAVAAVNGRDLATLRQETTKMLIDIDQILTEIKYQEHKA